MLAAFCIMPTAPSSRPPTTFTSSQPKEDKKQRKELPPVSSQSPQPNSTYPRVFLFISLCPPLHA